jgi:hypothetical protein
MTSQLMREASVRIGRARDGTPAARISSATSTAAATVEPASTRSCAEATERELGFHLFPK